MRFTIDAECKRGLRIIEELPDFQISRIEGYNGIGKTSALRLLELCTGSQPYQGQDKLWASFRDQLLHATVQVIGLQGGAREIVWDLDPSAWPPTAESLGELLGNVRIDGSPARCEDVLPLLRVHTIRGNETFTDTLAARLEFAARGLDAWVNHGSGAAWQRMEALETLLEESRKATQVPSAAEIKSLSLELANAEAHSTETALEFRRVQTRVAQLSEAKKLAEQLDDVRGRGPELGGQLADIERQQKALRDQRSSLDERITETGRREHQDEAARKEFALARQNFDRREGELQNSRNRFNAAAAEAGSDPKATRVAAKERELSARLDALTSRLPKANASPFIAELLGELADRLRRAEAAGLAGEVLIPGNSLGRDLTVRAWREICEHEAANRAAEGATETAQDLEREIAQVRQRLQLLVQVKDLSARAEHAAENRDRASQRLAKAIENLPSEDATTLDQLVSAREEIEAHLAELAERHASVQHALSLVGDGTDESTLRELLARICDEVGVPESRVRSQLKIEQGLLANAQEASTSSQMNADSARRRVEASTEAVGTALSALRQRPELSFAHNVAENLLSTTRTNVSAQAAELGALRGAMEVAAQGARGAVSRIQGIAEALDAIARQFRGTGGPSQGARWVRPVQDWLAGQVSEWFAHDEVRQALFPDGHEITVDIDEMAVSWTAGGERMTRPMTAFSSGQQALAYTRARIASLDSTVASSANRLIALDEFGAFIAADGMRHLSRYLLERHKTFPHDQVVVVLPLRQEIRNMPGPTDTVAAERWRQLQQRGYLTDRITR
ncbi:MAG TPA: hypothetical protein VFQ44_10225 [Streptosporangiaceae bacterium]|nr:hypothetical protein [Streptosporangiaceae bacterium]